MGIDYQWLSKRPYIVALTITAILILWMLSGAISTQEAPDETKQTAEVAKVQITTMSAQNIHSTLELYGRTEPNRTSTLKAEVRGRVIETLAKRGFRVSKGQAIVKIALNDLEYQLISSKALLEQRQIEYSGAKALKQGGNIGQAQLAQARFNIESIKAQIKTLTIAIENTVIHAPFDGVLDSRSVEVGDYLKVGDPVAVVADLSTLVVRAYATENQVNKLEVGQIANIRLLNQPKAIGEVRYIASLADEITNTFKVEITVDNTNYRYRSGLSGEVSIPLEKTWAIKLSPALLALDESGNIGVKSVVDKQVVFTPIDIIKSDTDGIWLTGLGKQANVISLGQGFVRAGDTVEPVMEED